VGQKNGRFGVAHFLGETGKSCFFITGGSDKPTTGEIRRSDSLRELQQK